MADPRITQLLESTHANIEENYPSGRRYCYEMIVQMEDLRDNYDLFAEYLSAIDTERQEALSIVTVLRNTFAFRSRIRGWHTYRDRARIRMQTIKGDVFEGDTNLRGLLEPAPT